MIYRRYMEIMMDTKEKPLKLLVKLSEHNRDLLDAASKKVGLSKAALINLAVRNYLEKPATDSSLDARLSRMVR
jgi:hypothetical protein